MQIVLSHADSRPIYEQIIAQVKSQILTGSLEHGEALPSIRLLAKELRISVITTKRAYEELERGGFIETIAAKGSFVAAPNREAIREEHMHGVEGHLEKAVALAKSAGITRRQVQDALDALW